MDKNINDNDRIIIGVREWAIEQTVREDMWKWLPLTNKEIYDLDSILEVAMKLEEHVLRDIKDKEKD